MILNYRIKPEVKVTEKEDTEGYQNVMHLASKCDSIYSVTFIPSGTKLLTSPPFLMISRTMDELSAA